MGQSLDPERPTVPEVLPLVWAYRDRPGNGSGGSLHIVLEDNNTEDGMVDCCIDRAERVGDVEGLELARILRRMSRSQRTRIARRFHDRPPV